MEERAPVPLNVYVEHAVMSRAFPLTLLVSVLSLSRSHTSMITVKLRHNMT